MAFFINNIDKLIREATRDIRSIDLNPQKTAVINVDVINGFFKEGNLSSPRLDNITSKIVRVNEYFLSSQKVFFVDTHTPESVELQNYPVHCTNDNERLIIKEMEKFSDGAEIIAKNSTNAFFAQKYVRWLSKNLENLDNYVITGGATDICVMQYALSQKAYLNSINNKSRVIVVENAVQTFDNSAHDGDQMQSFALYNMYINGILLVQI